MRSLEEIAASIESTPVVLRALLTPIDPEILRLQPEPGEWCALEVVGHLIAAEAPAFRDRIRDIIAGKPEIAGFNPSLELTGRDFASADLSDLVDELESERSVSATYVRSLDVDDLSRPGNFATYGTFEAGDFVHEWPFHDQDHLQQILAAIKPSYLPHMSDAMQQALGS